MVLEVRQLEQPPIQSTDAAMLGQAHRGGSDNTAPMYSQWQGATGISWARLGRSQGQIPAAAARALHYWTR